MEAPEFKVMVDSIRQVENALGEVKYPTNPSEIKGRDYCRSLYVAEDVRAGEVFTERNVRSVRPGYGLHPKYLDEILGRKAARSLMKGERFGFDCIETAHWKDES